MKEWVVPITVAVIALVGTLAGALLAHRRWRVDRGSKFADERRQVYKDIWERAEALNLQYRTGELTEASYRPALTALNVAMLKASPYLDEADRVLIRDYVQAVETFLSLLARTGDEETSRSVGRTDVIPPAVLARVKALAEAQETAFALRDKVVARLRAVLRAD